MADGRAPIVLCAGTWGLRGIDDLEAVAAAALPWWHPRSDFGVAALTHGLALIDGLEPFLWSTALDGIGGDNLGWYAGGAALRYFAHAKHPPIPCDEAADNTQVRDGQGWRPVSVIAHAHGGNVALYAAQQGLRIETLVTLGTPVRREMDAVAAQARPNMRRWVHVYSDSDPAQIAGALFDGRLGIYRKFPLAENILEPRVGHSDLHDPARWTARGWWKTFFAEPV
jgi:hypothetical protein